ncbi:MAG: hypothetical protein JWP13_540 [Candidatus Saccharibacteria bacterium]|nr:hypothetical protein [Candidatus Saccharibacteria bacterium]
MGTETKKSSRVALVLALLLAVNALAPALANAGALSNTYVRMNRMTAATATSFRLVFTTSSATATEDNIRIDFGTAWNAAGGLVNGTQSVSTATCATETGTTALPTSGSFTPSGTPSTSISLAGVNNLAASTAYCVDFNTANAVTLPTAGEYYATVETRSSTTVDDTARVAIRVVSNDSITVTASVPPIFDFALDANTTAFVGELTPGTKRQTTARTVTVNTNAKTGWVAWLRNSDGNGLYSAGVNANIAPTTPGTAVNVDAAASTEQYVWGVSSLTQGGGAGTTSIASAYDSSGGTNDGSGVDNTYRQVASSSGTSQNAVVTIVSSATISPITPAASDYTDIVQVIGAGNF